MNILAIQKIKSSLKEEPAKKQRLVTKGTSAVEFALILPVLILILFGIIEFGVIMYDQQVITNAAREGARRGIVQASPRISKEKIQEVVNIYASPYLISFSSSNPPLGVNVECDGTPGSCTVFGQNLSVEVTYPYSFLVLPNFVPGLSNFTLKSKSIMKCE